MEEEILETKRRLRKLGFNNLSVHKGRGTAIGWLEIRRKDGQSFTDEERKAIEEIFGKGTGSNFFCILREEAKMILKLNKSKPICPICGTTFETNELALACKMSH